MAAPTLQFKRGVAANVGLASFKAGEPGFTTDKYDFYIGLDATAANQKFFGSARYWARENGTTAAVLKLVDKNGSNSINLKSADTLAGIVTFRLPTADGSSNQAIVTDGSGNLSFASVTTSAGTLTGAGAGVTTFLVTPSSANLASAVIDETGSGSLVFANTPTLVTPILGAASATSINATGIITATGGFVGSLTGTATTSTRATTVDVTTAPNGVYYPALLNNYATGNGYSVYSDAGIYYVAQNDTLYINGNLSIGGTSGILNVTSLLVTDKDIIVGYTTDANGNDVSKDSTSTHGGIAVASTTGSPLFNMPIVSGVNSNPFTYKQFMWIAQGTPSYSGMGTDSWVSNYPIAIGTVTIQNNSRFTVGAGYTFYDNLLDATAVDLSVRNINAGIITATSFSGTITGTASTATRATTVDITATNAQTAGLVFGAAGNGATLYNDGDLTYNSNTNQLNVGILSAFTEVRTGAVKAADGTSSITITNSTGAVQTNNDLTVSGNLYVNGSTTQVNTSQITVEDRTIELGIVDGSAPSSTTTWDLGVLFNYHDGSAKKSALVWEQGDARFKLGSVISDGEGTGTTNPQITFTTYAALELSELWFNNTCTGGSSQVIACSGSNLILQNITIDGGQF